MICHIQIHFMIVNTLMSSDQDYKNERQNQYKQIKERKCLLTMCCRFYCCFNYNAVLYIIHESISTLRLEAELQKWNCILNKTGCFSS